MHQLGHVVGLDHIHSAVYVDSVMRDILDPGVRRTSRSWSISRDCWSCVCESLGTEGDLNSRRTYRFAKWPDEMYQSLMRCSVRLMDLPGDRRGICTLAVAIRGTVACIGNRRTTLIDRVLKYGLGFGGISPQVAPWNNGQNLVGGNPPKPPEIIEHEFQNTFLE